MNAENVENSKNVENAENTDNMDNVAVIEEVADSPLDTANVTTDGDTNHLKQLVHDISNLSINEMKEVFKLLDKNGVKYTENSNGIYIILSHVPIETIDNIKKFLVFCQNSKVTLDSIDNAQMNEKQNMDKIVKDVVVVSTDNKYVAKITYQNELDKYGLNLDETEILKPESEVIDLGLMNKTKVKFTGKSKIIKTQSKSNAAKAAKPKANDESC